jgi:hypothetical protein
MIVKEVIENQLFVWKIHSGGKKDLIYKRWLWRNEGRVFCKYGINFSGKEIDGLREKFNKGEIKH